MKRTSRRAQSPQAAIYHQLYYTPRWRRERAQHLAREPLCRMCARAGRQTKATTVDHIKPHGGDDRLFWDQANWQSLCDTHHLVVKRRMEAGGPEPLAIGPDGWPLP